VKLAFCLNYHFSRTKTYILPSEALTKEGIILFRRGYEGYHKLPNKRENQESFIVRCKTGDKNIINVYPKIIIYINPRA